jgi:hypothetical protein
VHKYSPHKNVVLEKVSHVCNQCITVAEQKLHLNSEYIAINVYPAQGILNTRLHIEHAAKLISKMHDASSTVCSILSPCVQRAPSMLINSFSGHCEHVTGEVEQREICEVAIV